MPSLPSEALPAADAPPVWAQPGITAHEDARRLLEALRSADTLVMPSADGDVAATRCRASRTAAGGTARASARA